MFASLREILLLLFRTYKSTRAEEKSSWRTSYRSHNQPGIFNGGHEKREMNYHQNSTNPHSVSDSRDYHYSMNNVADYVNLNARSWTDAKTKYLTFISSSLRHNKMISASAGEVMAMAIVRSRTRVVLDFLIRPRQN